MTPPSSEPQWTVRASSPGPEIATVVITDDAGAVTHQRGQLHIAASLRADWDIITRSLEHGASLMLRAPSGRSHRIQVTGPVSEVADTIVVGWSGSDVQLPGPRPVAGRHHRPETGT